jgi:hypothetical protein
MAPVQDAQTFWRQSARGCQRFDQPGANEAGIRLTREHGVDNAVMGHAGDHQIDIPFQGQADLGQFEGLHLVATERPGIGGGYGFATQIGESGDVRPVGTAENHPRRTA